MPHQNFGIGYCCRTLADSHWDKNVFIKICNFDLNRTTEVLIEKGILSSEDSHYTYKETHYNASSNEENGGCLIVPIIITLLTVLVAYFNLWSLIISLPITIASWGIYSLFKDSKPNPERDISFITNRFHHNLEHSFRCFQGGSHDYEDVIILLSQEE